MEIVDLTDDHMLFVSSCTHIDDLDEEKDRARRVRESWLRNALMRGLKVKVAIDKGKPVGFAHCLPIELGTWGMSGKNFMTIPCLTLSYKRVYECVQSSGFGRSLIGAVEAEARKNKKGVAVLAYDFDFWFMPASFFKKLGYKEVKRQGSTVIMLKAFEEVDPPYMHRLNYNPKLMEGKVVIDVFWNPICLTSIIEIHRVRDVCAEYKNEVALREFNCGNKEVLEKYQTSRALFFNGKYKFWGYEAPRDELRKRIEEELKVHSQTTK
jgi:GNAT superfamily N-acetyltransferase